MAMATAALLAPVLALGGCGGADPISHPTGQNQVVVQVTTGGGLVPIEYNVTLVPEFSLYGDGRVVVPGPQIDIYPGPALPNIQTAMISEEAVQAMLVAAQDAGLFDPTFDYGTPGVADGPTTTVEIYAGDATYRSAIYALTIAGAGGLSLEQQQARAAVNDLVGKLALVSPFVTDEIAWAPYRYSALAVYSQPLGDDPVPDGGVTPNRLEWPLDDLSLLGEEVPQGGFRRVVISGEDLEKLRPLVEQATEITLWESGGIDYRLLLRPLLPEETQGVMP